MVESPPMEATMRSKKLFLTLATFVLMVSPIVLAKTKHAPLPQEVIQAKTVYIVNLAGAAAFRDKAYDEITKWGRFKVVPKREDADLIFVLSAREYRTAMVTNSNTTGTVDESGNV